MTAYKILKDSLVEEEGYLRCKVLFYDDEGVQSEEQFYEVQGLSKEALVRSLEKAAKAYASSKRKEEVEEEENILVGRKVNLK